MEHPYDDPYIPAEEIPDSSTLPENTYEFRVVELQVQMSRGGPGKIPKLMVMPVLEVSAGPFEGTPIQIGPFLLGTDADPYAKNPLTWTRPQAAKAFAVIRFGRFLRAIGLKQNARLSDLCRLAEGRRGLVLVKIQSDNDPMSEYYGRERNTVPDTGWLPLGQGSSLMQRGPRQTIQETPNGPDAGRQKGPSIPRQPPAHSIPSRDISEIVAEGLPSKEDDIPF